MKDVMPRHGVNVLATYKNRYKKTRFIVGHYLDRWKEESSFEDGVNDEYSETLENYFYKAGWYEKIDNWDDFNAVSVVEGEITHWMPLPNAPQ